MTANDNKVKDKWLCMVEDIYRLIYNEYCAASLAGRMADEAASQRQDFSLSADDVGAAFAKGKAVLAGQVMDLIDNYWSNRDGKRTGDEPASGKAVGKSKRNASVRKGSDSLI